jgi:hypothetical protein
VEKSRIKKRTGPANLRSGKTIAPDVKSILFSIEISLHKKRAGQESGISTRHLIQLVISKRITHPPMMFTF